MRSGLPTGEVAHDRPGPAGRRGGGRATDSFDRDGDGSFDAFVAARTGALLRTAYLLTGDQQLAEDLVQSALVKASLRWRRIVAKGHPEPYVRTVLYREHVSSWRRRKVAEVLAAELPEPRRPTAPDFVDELAESDSDPRRAPAAAAPPARGAGAALLRGPSGG